MGLGMKTSAVAVCVLVLFAASSALAGEKPLLVVYKAKKAGGANASQAEVLADLIVVQDIGETERFTVEDEATAGGRLPGGLTGGFESCADATCVAEFGNAVGAVYVVMWGVWGAENATDGQTISLTLVGAQSRVAIVSKSARLAGGKGAVEKAIHKGVLELMQSVPATPPRAAPVAVTQTKAPEAVAGARELSATRIGSEVAPPPPGGTTTIQRPIEISERDTYNFWGHVTFWSGLGVAAFGGISLGMASKAGSDYEYDGSANAKTRSENWAGLGFASMATGGVLMGTGVVLWLMEPEKKRPATAGQSLFSVQPNVGGGSLVMIKEW